MATTTEVRTGRSAPVELVRPSRTLWGDAWHNFRRHRLAMAGLIALGTITLATLLGPFLWPLPINDIDCISAELF